MRSIKRVIKYQYIDSKKSILSFWSVVLLFDIFIYSLNKASPLNTGSIGFISHIGIEAFLSIVGVNLLLFFMYFVTYSYESYYKVFPMAISFSVTRKDYFKSLIVKSLLVSVIFALIQGVLFKIDPLLVKSTGRNPVYDFLVFNTKMDNLIYIIFSIFMISMTLISIFNLVFALSYRFGYIIWIIFGVLQIILSAFSNFNLIDRILNMGSYILNTRIDIFQFIRLGISIVLLHLLTYIVTIKIVNE